jgi:hypothetical protein
VLNTMLVTYLFKYSGRIKDPVNSQRYLLFEGTEMFMVLLLATSTLALSSGEGGHGAGSGFNLQAIRLLFLEIFLVLSFFVSTHPPKWGPGMVAYLIYILWLLYSLTYTPSVKYGFRYILKYLYPLLMMLACSAIVRDEKVFLSICVWLRRVAIVSTLFVVFPFIRIPMIANLFWYDTALNMHYVVVACVSFALFFLYGKDWKDLVIGILFFLPCILETHRTGLLCIFCGTAIFFFYKFKAVSLPYIAVTLGIGIAIIFYVPSFHEKMFWRESEKGEVVTIRDLKEGNIKEEDIRNNGREALWDILSSNFYDGHKLKGSGIGSCQYFLYEMFTGVKQTHGDYIQMKCDTGLIGMWLYIGIGIVILIHCFIVTVSPYEPDYVKCCAMIAAGAIAGQYFAMYSDNAVTYTMATTGTSFAFYGMMLGLKENTVKPREELSATHL